MIVHLFPWSKALTPNWISYVGENFTDKEHYIFVYGRPDPENEKKISAMDNVWIVHDFSGNAIKKEACYNILMESMMKCDSMVLHFARIELLKYLLHFPTIMEKTRIVCWGGDIELLKNYQKKKLVRWIVNKNILSRSFSQAYKVGFLLKEDQEWVKKIIPSIKKSTVVLYQMEYWKDRDHYYLEEKPKDSYWIQLGNSATETNHHIEIIEKLAKYKGEAFKLYVPLSYGDPQYAEKVIKIGYKYLGEQFIPITDYMSYEKYCELLSKMTVVIHNHYRQQGLGNIVMALQYGSKIYMNTFSPSWSAFHKQGYVLYDQKEIGEIPFESFVHTDPKVLLANRERQLEEDNKYQQNIDNWRQFFYEI